MAICSPFVSVWAKLTVDKITGGYDAHYDGRRQWNLGMMLPCIEKAEELRDYEEKSMHEVMSVLMPGIAPECLWFQTYYDMN